MLLEIPDSLYQKVTLKYKLYKKITKIPENIGILDIFHLKTSYFEFYLIY